ncbi:hypothetical protein ASE76_03515 [Xylophilus sp. Leaf220]|nr:hypothetical protein ASE76_03515 [Xylophilus sp. Leaf220]
MLYENEVEISNYWRLCDSLSVRQAALLVIGEDPASEVGTYCESWRPSDRPRGYEAAKQGIGNALSLGTIEGRQVEQPQFDPVGTQVGTIPGSLDVDLSTVDRHSLVKWLTRRGFRSGFFFPEAPASAVPGYLDPLNERYAPKLAAAVEAWLATGGSIGKPPRQALVIWLREHAVKFGLSDAEGMPNEAEIDQTATVAVWQ